MRKVFELAQVVERFEDELVVKHAPNAYVRRTLNAIRYCRTSALGGHVDKCDACGHIRISYNSCRNRHCPKCQNTQREAWIESRKQDVLPVPYFHVVFTVPDKLNGLFIRYPVIMYNLLFQSAWQTINQFSFTKLHAETGMVALLHTWGQNLSLHPHVHCVVPGGGVDYKGQWREVKVSENGKVFLFDVKNLSTVFRGKFMDALKKHLSPDKQLVNSLYRQNWVVYAKEPFAGAEQVIEYMGRYTHKVAISNHRLLKIDDSGVTFRWRDYRDNKQKVMTLDGAEFLRRFCQHILPKGFVRIRYYGLLSSSKRELLGELKAAFGVIIPLKNEKRSWKEICVEHLDYNPDICPHCGKGRMIPIERISPSRAPPAYSNTNENARSNQH